MPSPVYQYVPDATWDTIDSLLGIVRDLRAQGQPAAADHLLATVSALTIGELLVSSNG